MCRSMPPGRALGSSQPVGNSPASNLMCRRMLASLGWAHHRTAGVPELAYHSIDETGQGWVEHGGRSAR